MKEGIEEKIKQEIKFLKDKHGKGWGMYFFNNFDLKLPGGLFYSFEPEILNRRSFLNRDDASEIRKNQTTYEFLSECEKSIVEEGLTFEQIIEFRKEKNENENKESDFFEMLIPVYINLRKKGYNHYPDLTG